MSIDTSAPSVPAPTDVDTQVSQQWTARLRRSAESAFPPDRLIPDRER